MSNNTRDTTIDEIEKAYWDSEKRRKDRTLDAYQNEAGVTAIYPNKGSNLDYPTKGLASEVGELFGHLKKMDRDDRGIMTAERRAAIIAELGDILWYVAMVSTELKTSLSHVAELNLMKLKSRAERGELGGYGDDR